MRDYWDGRARDNAAWYVDTSLSYDDPDMEKFFETGRVVKAIALDDAPVKPAGRALAVEIGSGLGRICAALAEEFDGVVGVDISTEMVKRATELVADPKVRFEVVDGASLAPVSDGEADFVMSFTVFQHIPSVAVIDAYIAEAGRVLRPGGVFAFQWNNIKGHRRWALRRWLLDLMQRTGLRPERHGRHAAQFLGSRVPLSHMEQVLTAAGMRLRSTREEGTLYAWAWAEKV